MGLGLGLVRLWLRVAPPFLVIYSRSRLSPAPSVRVRIRVRIRVMIRVMIRVRVTVMIRG